MTNSYTTKNMLQFGSPTNLLLRAFTYVVVLVTKFFIFFFKKIYKIKGMEYIIKQQ